MKNKKALRVLKEELNYHRMMLKVDINAVKAGIRKCKEIGARMRALQRNETL